jgi:tetratricopeptide (TPR) repeat protein
LENQKVYEPDTTVLNKIKEHKDFKVIIYGATWCGDTRAELPKFSKILNQIKLKDNRYEMYMVDNAGKNYEQSPDKTPYTSSIFCVPTFIIEKDGKEIERIIEEPTESLEKDLLQILESKPYNPSCALVELVQKFVNAGKSEVLKGKSVIENLYNLKDGSGVLNSYGYILLGQEYYKNAIAVFHLNTRLFLNDANTFDSLGEAYYFSGKLKPTKKYYARALELEPGLKSAQEMLLKIG